MLKVMKLEKFSPIFTSSDVVTSSSSINSLSNLFCQLRFSKHSLKPTSNRIIHPYIPEPENLNINKTQKPNLDPLQTFLPLHYNRERKIEQLRSGQFLGDDYPWNLLKKWRDWKRRRYNCIYHTSSPMISDVKGIHYNERLNCWSAQWHENGVHRIRRFRAAYGLMKSKESAESFRLNLEATGRVDNMRTERQMRLQYISKKAERQLRKQRFAKISSGQF